MVFLLRFLFRYRQIYTDNLAVNVLKVPHKDLLRWQPMELVCLSDSTSSGPIVDHFQTSPTSHNWLSIWLNPPGNCGCRIVVIPFVF